MNAGREIDRLYEQPLDRFTAERNELMKKLRAAGEKEAAAAVGKVRKPSAPVWAINQVARAGATLARNVIEAGEGLRDAQRRILKGGDPAALRDAAAQERKAVMAFVARVEDVLREAELGTSTATLERVRDTVFAVSTDADLHEEFLAGRMSEERQRAGFGEFPDLKLVESPPEPADKAKRSDARTEARERRRAEQEQRLGDLRARLAEAEDEAAGLERKSRSARRRADELRDQVAAAERALERS